MKKMFLGLIVGMMMLTGIFVPLKAFAEPDNICDDTSIPEELREAAGCRTDEERNETIMPIVMGVIQVALGVIGLVAVIILVYGAIIYTTSTGDARKIYQAKNIILYAIVGLVVSGLSYATVFFVSQALWGK